MSVAVGNSSFCSRVWETLKQPEVLLVAGLAIGALGLALRVYEIAIAAIYLIFQGASNLHAKHQELKRQEESRQAIGELTGLIASVEALNPKVTIQNDDAARTYVKNFTSLIKSNRYLKDEGYLIENLLGRLQEAEVFAMDPPTDLLHIERQQRRCEKARQDILKDLRDRKTLHEGLLKS